MNYQQQKQLQRRKAWIYIRYAFPLLAALLILLAMRLPCMQFTTADTGTNDAISAHELMSNAWDQARECLFGGMEDPTEASIAFSRTVMTVILVCGALFLVGIVIAVWALVTVVRFRRDPKEGDVWRISFVTLVPNRTVLCLWMLCLLPLPAFPRLLVIIYETMMNYSVGMDVTFAEPLILALLLWITQIIFSSATANAERATNMDVFRSFQKQKEEENPSEPEAITDAPTARITQEAKKEQLDEIRRLLSDEDDQK